MKGSRVAKRYARALLDLADKGTAEKWGAELARLAAVLAPPSPRPLRDPPDKGTEEKGGAELERLAAMVESPELLERLASPELSEQSRQGGGAESGQRPK